jgi:hypothetical protein
MTDYGESEYSGDDRETGESLFPSYRSAANIANNQKPRDDRKTLEKEKRVFFITVITVNSTVTVCIVRKTEN